MHLPQIANLRLFSGAYLHPILIVICGIFYYLIVANDFGLGAFAWMGDIAFDTPTLAWHDLSFRGIFDFFKDLRTGISPIHAFVEIVVQMLFSSLVLIEKGVYRGSLVLSYLLPLMIFKSNIPFKILYILTSFFYLTTTHHLHRALPFCYDVEYGALAIGIVCATYQMSKTKKVYLLAFFIGLLLTVLELTRPFVLLMLPFLLLIFWLAFTRKKQLLMLFIPITLISGLWHLKVFTLHDGQVLWSNHGGFNMYRRWELDVSQEAKQAYHKGMGYINTHGRGSLNTSEHFYNSTNLTKEIVKSWTRMHPWEFSKRLYTFNNYTLSTTRIYGEAPTHLFFDVYSKINKLIFGLIILQLILVAYYFLKKRRLEFLGAAILVNSVIAISTIFISSICEQGENARYMISVAPLFALSIIALPTTYALYTDLRTRPTISSEPNQEKDGQNNKVI